MKLIEKPSNRILISSNLFKMKKYLIILFLITNLFQLYSQTTEQEAKSFKIIDIKVEGLKNSNKSSVISYSGLRIGDVISLGSDVIPKSIKSLMDRGLYSDAKIYVEDIENKNGATIIINIVEYSRINDIKFKGNDEFDNKDLDKEIVVRIGDIANPYDLLRSSNKIKKKYSDEGYLFSSIKYLIDKSLVDTNRVDVTFVITEGPDVKIGNIYFDGNQKVLSSDLKGSMNDVKEKSWWQFWRSSKFVKTKLAKDKEKIVEYYKKNGFIDAEVLNDSITINNLTGRADVYISVREGKQTYLRNVVVLGNVIYPSEVIERRLEVKKGEIYNQTQFDKNLSGNEEQSDIQSLYLDNGFLTANVQKMEDRIEDSVDVTVKITEGPQAKFRYISIAGNTKTKDKVIRRELYTYPGDLFSRSKIIRSLRNLAGLNYFNPEKLQPQINPVDATSVDVTYTLEEKPSDTFNASLGISSQGLSGMLGVTFNNFSLAEPLSGGAGQILNFNYEKSAYGQTFMFGITEPWLFDEPTTLGSSISFNTYSSPTSDYSYQSYVGSVTVGRRLRWPDDYFRIDGAVRYSNNHVTSSSVSNYTNGDEFTIAINFSRNSIDNPVFPTVGSKFNFGNTFAVLADAKYTKHEISTDFYSNIFNVSETMPVVFYLGFNSGMLNVSGDVNKIQPLTFYSMGGSGIGGYNTIPLRGYPDSKIGTYLNNSTIPTSKVYVKANAEIRISISQNPIPIFFPFFAECGNAWENLDKVNIFNLKRTVGAGIRVVVPGVGLLGFDYAYGFDKDINGQVGGWQTHFQFGR